MISIDDKARAADGRPAGFDYMRLVLALMVVLWHTCVISYGPATQQTLSHGLSRPVWALILPMFFALSGFLVSGSIERSRTLVSFLGARVIRLGPALAVESALAILVLGAAFTTLPLTAYFADPRTASYLLNIVGDIHYHLPGVFESNPVTSVNGQLWTLPYELQCYASLAVIIALGAYRRGWLLIALVVVAQAVVAYFDFANGHSADAIVPGMVMVLCFLFGASLYRFRAHIPHSFSLFAGSAALSVALVSIPGLAPFCALPVAYMTVYLGMLNPPRSVAVSSGDYSYGIFLYGFPIQQAVAALFPAHHVWWFNFLLAAPLSAFVAALSWHFVEKPALNLRRPLKQFEDWVLSLSRRSALENTKAFVPGP